MITALLVRWSGVRPAQQKNVRIYKIAGTLLAVLVCGLTLVPSRATVAFSGLGEGSLSSPNRITSCDQFNEMHVATSENYVLMNDIDCSSIDWQPMGFVGTLDGRNHTVTGINSTATDSYSGVFTQTNSAVIKNIKFTNLTINNSNSSSNYIGGLAGDIENSTITNVQLSGSVTGGTVVGGLAGLINNSTVSKSSFTGSVTDTTGFGGGFAAIATKSAISDCFVNVTYIGANLGGGFIGNFSSDNGTPATITRSYAVGTVTNPNYAAGFISRPAQYSTGAVSISDSFSVVSGWNGTNNQIGAIASVQSGAPTASNFYYSGDDAKTNWCGGLLTCIAVNADGSDPNHFKNNSTVAPFDSGWDFVNVWQTNVGGYPTLRDASSLDTLTDLAAPSTPTSLQITRTAGHTIQVDWTEGTTGGSAITNHKLQWKLSADLDWTSVDTASGDPSGTISGIPVGNIDVKVAAENGVGLSTYSQVAQYTLPDPQVISDCDELQAITSNPEGIYVLANDIDCVATSEQNSNGTGGYYGFDVINDFSGELDGAGHTVSNVYINRPQTSGIGIFRDLYSGGEIHDATFSNIDITSDSYTGGVVAYPNGGSIIDNVTVSGSIYSNYSAGGIAGYTEVGGSDLTITNSTVDVSISRTDGGQWGENWGGVIGYYYAYGDSTFNLANNQVSVDMMDENTNALGGLIGYAELYSGAQMSLESNTSSGNIGCGSDCGGVIGMFYSEWDGEHPRQALTIADSFSDALVLSINGNVGGYIGSYDANGSDATISTSGRDGNVEGYQGDNMGGFIGRTGSDGHYPQISISESYVTNLQQNQNQNEMMNSGSNLGGMVGNIGTNTHVVIENSYVDNSFIIGWGINTGGLVGNNEERVDIANSYAAGWFGAAGGNVGGLVGHMTNGSIANSFSSSDVEEIEGYLGAVIGLSDGANTITNTYYNASPIDINNLPNCLGSEPNPEGCIAVNSDGSQEDYFIDNNANEPLDEWDFGDIWVTKSNQFPRLQWTLPPPANPNISDCTELQNVTNHVTEDFTLTEDIDCTGFSFTPIGSLDYMGFQGTLDGAGHNIYGQI